VNLKELFYEMKMCHQAIFYKKSLFYEIGKYSTNFKIAGDYEWMLRYYLNKGVNSSDFFVNRPLVRFEMGGLSTNYLLAFKERKRIAKNILPTNVYINFLLMSLFMVPGYHLVRLLNDTTFYKIYRKIYFTHFKSEAPPRRGWWFLKTPKLYATAHSIALIVLRIFFFILSITELTLRKPIYWWAQRNG